MVGAAVPAAPVVPDVVVGVVEPQAAANVAIVMASGSDRFIGGNGSSVWHRGRRSAGIGAARFGFRVHTGVCRRGGSKVGQS